MSRETTTPGGQEITANTAAAQEATEALESTPAALKDAVAADTEPGGQQPPEVLPSASQADEAPDDAGEPGAVELDEADGKLSREVARYRAAAREAETEVARLTSLLEDLSRGEAEQAVAAVLTNPADLWEVGGHTPADFVDETGEVDTERAAAAGKELARSRPGLSARKLRVYTNHQGMRTPAPPTSRPGLGDALELVRPNRV